jgi:membrane protein YdbS with pleckstrin-like domain
MLVGDSLELRAISPRFWLARQVSMAGMGVLLLGLGLVVAVLAAQQSAAAGGAVGALFVVSLVAGWVVEWGRYRSWRYGERENDLVVMRGLLFRRVSVVPYGRMQFIDVTAGPVDRLFGLATVQLHTAAAASDARIPGLLRADAEELRDRLAAVGEARATGL